MIKLVSDTIDRQDINILIEWLQQDPIPKLTKGELTKELEKKWAKKLGTKYSVYVNSGSSAILLTLAALKESGKLKNNKIVVPALSWATDVSSPMLLGYDITMCDCNLQDLSCDLEALEIQFKENDPSVLILVSPLGLVPKMEKVVDLCKKYNVLLLEDVCESMGSKYNGKYLGSFGFASFFSMNLRSTDLQAFIGLRAIDKLDKYSLKRRENFKYYVNNLITNKLKLEEKQNDYVSSFAIPVIHPRRNEVIQDLMDNKIEVRPLIAGNMANKPMWKGSKKGLENCELVETQGFYIPNHQDLTKEDINKIVKIINKYG